MYYLLPVLPVLPTYYLRTIYPFEYSLSIPDPSYLGVDTRPRYHFYVISFSVPFRYSSDSRPFFFVLVS